MISLRVQGFKGPRGQVKLPALPRGSSVAKASEILGY